MATSIGYVRLLSRLSPSLSIYLRGRRARERERKLTGRSIMCSADKERKWMHTKEVRRPIAAAAAAAAIGRVSPVTSNDADRVARSS